MRVRHAAIPVIGVLLMAIGHAQRGGVIGGGVANLPDSGAAPQRAGAPARDRRPQSAVRHRDHQRPRGVQRGRTVAPDPVQLAGAGVTGRSVATDLDGRYVLARFRRVLLRPGVSQRLHQPRLRATRANRSLQVDRSGRRSGTLGYRPRHAPRRRHHRTHRRRVRGTLSFRHRCRHFGTSISLPASGCCSQRAASRRRMISASFACTA